MRPETGDREALAESIRITVCSAYQERIRRSYRGLNEGGNMCDRSGTVTGVVDFRFIHRIQFCSPYSVNGIEEHNSFSIIEIPFMVKTLLKYL